MREEPWRISTKEYTFLWGKEIHKEREDHTLVKIYGFQDKPFLLPKFVINRYFVGKVY